jgi:hypothetical protein
MGHGRHRGGAAGGLLARRCPGVSVLHDRRMPNRRTNIDHLAIARSGVYVIDAKRYKGKIEVRKRFRGEEKLFIAGRDKAKLVDGLKRQAEAVRAGLELIEQPVPLHACFCFINPEGRAGGSGIPLFRTWASTGFSCSTHESSRSA